MQRVDIFDEMETFFRDLEEMYSDAGILPPLSSPTSKAHPQQIPKSPHIYPPVNAVARWIWDQCNFGLRIRQHRVGAHLHEWAKSNNLYVKDRKEHIAFSYNGTNYIFQWPAFEKWFLCACTKVGNTQQ